MLQTIDRLKLINVNKLYEDNIWVKKTISLFFFSLVLFFFEFYRKYEITIYIFGKWWWQWLS